MKPLSSRDSVTLAPLTSIRFFAALHIFIFHIDASRVMGTSDLTRYPIFDQIPSWMHQFVRHGYCSTSLFFILSGFILTYLYVDQSGQVTVPWRTFLAARFSRLYPLHILLVLALVPVAFGFQRPDPTFFTVPISHTQYVLVGLLLSVTLTQAWVPEFALSYNFPTWSLSAIVFCYLLFPRTARAINALSLPGKRVAMLVLPVLALLPSVMYSVLVPEEVPMSFGSEFVMRTPLFWWPHFAMGMLLARLFNITRYDLAWKSPAEPRSLVSAGDLAALALLVIFSLDDATLKKLACLNLTEPHLMIRHGLLSPLYWVLIYDLAQGKGWLARMLSWRPLEYLGEASFSIFMWQLPMFIVAFLLGEVWPWDSGSFVLLITVILVGVSLFSVRLFEKPVGNWLKRKSINSVNQP